MTLILEQLGVPPVIEQCLANMKDTYDFLKRAEKGTNNELLLIARNKVLKRDVALKFYFWGDGVRQHIEPAALAAVRSESIIDVLDARVIGDEYALFVTPFCEKGDLDRFLSENRFGLRDGIRFVEKLLHGVSTLHANDYVHRDLKPENILVSDEVGPLIADFGSARKIEGGETSVVGSGHSALFRPPESFASRRYDRRGDIYQVGMVLFRVLGGRLSYDGLTRLNAEERGRYDTAEDDFERTRIVDDAICRCALEQRLLPMDTLPFFVPDCVKRIIRKATASDSGERYQETGDMASALQTAVGRSADWRYKGDDAIAFNGEERLRLVAGSTAKRRVIQQKRMGPWRKLPKSQEGTVKNQLRVIDERCGVR